MDQLTLPFQTSFIAGRNIMESNCSGSHSLYEGRGRKAGGVAIQVDLEKAFDRLRWDFIHDTLVDIGLPSSLIHVIMHCITTPTMHVLWNGRPTDAFNPSRVVRQGDPISPYIFVLCMERISQTICKLVDEGHWHAIKMSRRGPSLSHLFFADDLILFGTTDMEQIQLIKETLEAFCLCSDQKISHSKSNIFFSHNVSSSEVLVISQFLGFPSTNKLGKSLRIPLT